MACRGGVKASCFFDRGNGWRDLPFFICTGEKACVHIFNCDKVIQHHNIHAWPVYNSSSAWAQNTSKLSHICSSVKMIPDNANVTANESVKLFSWCFSGVKRQHVSWSLKRFSPWVRAGGHACSDGGDTASSMEGGGGSWRKSIPRVSVLLRQVCRPLSHLIGQRSAACLDIHG